MCTVLLPLAATRLVRAKAESEREVPARAHPSNIATKYDQEKGNEAKLEPPANVTRAAINISANESSPDIAPQSGQSSPVQSSPPNLQEPKNEMNALDSNGFSVEEQNRLMSNDVGPAYIYELEGAGYHQLTVAQLIALYTNDVHADYVAALNSVGYGGLPPKELIALKTNGITTDVIRSFQAVRYADFKARNYIAFRSNGVTPAYLKSMQATGYDRLTPKQIVDMWVAGVTAEFIKAARSRGYSGLSPEQLIELKQHGSP